MTHSTPMRVYFMLTLLSLALTVTIPLGKALADSTAIAKTDGSGWPWKARFNLMGGYRVDNLDWNIGGHYTSTWNGGVRETRYINILSELSWRDLEIYQLSASCRVVAAERFYFRGALGYGAIIAGENQDSDYKGDNRTLEFSRSNNASDDGHVQDFSMGFGYLFQVKSGRIGLAPLFGYSDHRQYLKMHDGYQTLSVPPDQNLPEGPFEGLDSSYDASWRGPWIGLDFLVHWPKRLWIIQSMDFDLGVEAHWATYYAQADWNLATRFQHPKSFEHEADGTGIVLHGEWLLAFARHWELALRVDHQRWSTDSGTDRVFLSNGTVAETRLNEVNWESTAFSLGIACRF